ncbi:MULTISPECIES: HemK/PrmC family methyltransferase [unclassified Campylobacter]|uniref:HemK/PrmC family methyltransferase n=1 Tax=unclassified Campylobacter TaxID=2593542 RepID=UPI0012380FF4|nr:MULTISPECIES: HemK/PrmC family methyltransferase [unclassified Campylobacter]KAA6224884.1 peptide chain release factor N(5)-glutamine methyltransferase [Campylobacter sp. LR185c]KAA6226331.1 peptide chain release factor N(5)-glutamine methyltransferase [Campylobacter sp. LR286c]KAA6226823.1 peptide chain release factor N(5)-glutamine methyltransferase [Campylobacter sp. LR196d]KAA6230260.1 peptide chain release factor N(5)-glutamine methyltransferase [Campylobacter sp. LR291e]KAA6233781.1 p
MTIKNALTLAKSSLNTHKEEAVFILCEYLQKDRTWLFLNENKEFNEKPYFKLIKRFKKGVPFEYLFKKANFYGLDFKIKKGILIPRYDSEILLLKICEIYKKYKPKKILEIGFGSGILSIILAKKFNCKITACDISKRALKMAKKNAKIHQVSHLINFVLMDFKKIKGNFDFIFSNPPYIKNTYKLDKWVLSEPKKALYGGVRGYEILQDIIDFSYKKRVKFLACEFGHDQKEILKKILKKKHFKAEFFKDENNFDRVFYAINTK